MAYRNEQSEASIADLVSMAYGEIESLNDEVSSWRDGMQGTNLENSDKYSTLEEACSALEQVAGYEPDVPAVLEAVRVTYGYSVNTRKGRGLSRAVRLGDACGQLGCIVSQAQSVADDDEQLRAAIAAAEECEPEAVTEEQLQEARDAISEFTDAVEEHVGEVEGVEFPGMF